MPKLQDILYKVAIRSVKGDVSMSITDLQIDSRKIKKGSVFIAIRGGLDGHQFIDKAIENGAGCIICEALPSSIRDDVTYVQVEDSGQAAGEMAHNYYGHPSEKLQLVGVTGTNGKTTVATLLFK